MAQRAPKSNDAESGYGGDAHLRLRRFDRLVRQSRLVLLFERAWPRIWLVLAVLLIFLTTSWLGLWLDASANQRMLGLSLFGLAFAASLWPLFRLAIPTRRMALDRLDTDAGLVHGPARALEDSLASGKGDAGSEILWALHRHRAEVSAEALRVTAPRTRMAQTDRYAMRAAGLLALIASAFIAGPEIGLRLGAAFDWRQGAQALPTMRIDGWIDPPLYTRSPPLMINLASGSQHLRVPMKSTVVIRVAGEGNFDIEPSGGLSALPSQAGSSSALREQRYVLDADARLNVKTGLLGGATLSLEAIPDRPPEISFNASPEVDSRGGFVLAYKGRDDYGIASAQGVVGQGEGFKSKRTLVPPPQITLGAPGHREEDEETRATVDLSDHAWAGARVKLHLKAIDDSGQEGMSNVIDFTLPQKPFTQPIAKALVEQRRILVLDPEDRKRVQVALDSLLINPERFTPEWGVFLGLRFAADRLRRAKSDQDMLDVADWVYAMALDIENGRLSEAERDLRAAQERLREAMDKGAPQDEIKRLTDELRRAMDKFLREFAERMQRQLQQGDNQNRPPPDRVISQGDLERMLQQMEEAMRRGDMAEAQRLLDELRDILENLQTAQPNGPQDSLGQEMNEAMRDLDALSRDQQQLRDETFRDGQSQRLQQGERGRRSQQGQRQRGQGQRGEQGQNGQGNQAQDGQGQDGQSQNGEGLSDRQQALRDRLQQLQRQMRGMGMEGEEGFGDAEQAMRDAREALGQGSDEDAVDAQGRAIEGLQRGMQGMAQQMQDMMQGDGNQQADGNQPGGRPGRSGPPQQRDLDPLGRPTQSRGYPQEGQLRGLDRGTAMQRAQRILDELRRKLGDPARPGEELDYFERLLKQN